MIGRLRSMDARMGLVTIIAFNILLFIEYLANPGDASAIVGIYWVQSILFAMENVLLILFAKTGEPMTINGEPSKTGRGFNFFMAIFFVIHHGIFLMLMGLLAVLDHRIPGGTYNIPWIRISVLILIVLMVIDLPRKVWSVMHRSPGVFKLMFVPYIRLFPFVLLIFGVEHILIAPLMLLFILMKMGVDLVYHFYMKI